MGRTFGCAFFAIQRQLSLKLSRRVIWLLILLVFSRFSVSPRPNIPPAIQIRIDLNFCVSFFSLFYIINQCAQTFTPLRPKRVTSRKQIYINSRDIRRRNNFLAMSKIYNDLQKEKVGFVLYPKYIWTRCVVIVCSFFGESVVLELYESQYGFDL